MNNYEIEFCPLRGTNNEKYTLAIGGGTGTAIKLNGGAQVFTTEENDDDDAFAPIRTQTGSFRIVDNGKDAGGSSLGSGWWKDLVPDNDKQRPVTLTDGNGNTLWQGFMQAQNFGAELYNPMQERDYPVQCCLSILAATRISTSEALLCNFAYLLRYIMSAITPHSISQYVIQGGNDARTWLLKRVDWHNFLNNDSDGNLEARYNLYEVLEDICRFWGWTARTQGTVMYLTCADDAAEQTLLTLTPTELTALADSTDTSAGTVTAVPEAITISGDVYGSTDNDDYKYRGPNKATVKADVNAEDNVLQFAPSDVRAWLGDNYGEWSAGETLIGYFSTPVKRGTFDGNTLKIYASSTGGFCRRQIFTSEDSDNASMCDMMMVLNGYSVNSPSIQLQTKIPTSFAGGSLSLGGKIWRGVEQMQHSQNMYGLWLRLGIGMTYESARWWYMKPERSVASPAFEYGWYDSPQTFFAPLSGGELQATGYNMHTAGLTGARTFPAIPMESNAYGYIFIDIMGAYDFGNYTLFESFEVSNLTIGFSRDSITLEKSRPRKLIVKRTSSQEYTATNNNNTQEEWNADCIFASDNNMEYGYGLLMNADGTFMDKARYGNLSSEQHPEQHLANRVANYWATSRRKITGDYRSSVLPAITPADRISIDSTTGQPVAISHDWHNDITRISMLEL